MEAERLALEIPDSALLEAITASAATLDSAGRITAANRAWLRFMEAGQGVRAACGIGDDYLAACRSAALRGDVTAGKVLDRLQGLLGGERAGFSLDYAVYERGTRRWLRLIALAARHEGRPAFLVLHADVTARRKAGAAPPDCPPSAETLRPWLWDFAYGLRVCAGGRAHVDWLDGAVPDLLAGLRPGADPRPLWRAQVVPADLARLQGYEDRLLAGQEAEAEIRVSQARGAVRWLKLHGLAKPPTADGGAKGEIRAVCAVKDITAERRSAIARRIEQRSRDAATIWPDLPAALRAFLVIACEEAGWPAAEAWCPEDRLHLRRAAAWQDPDAGAAVAAAGGTAEVVGPESVPGQVRRRREALWIETGGDDAPADAAPSSPAARPPSRLAVPLADRRGFIAALCFFLDREAAGDGATREAVADAARAVVPLLRRLQAGRSTLEAQRLLETVVDNLPGAVFRRRLTHDGRITIHAFGESAAALYGARPTGQAAGQEGFQADAATLVHPDDWAAYHDAVLRSARTLTPCEVELRVRARDGGQRWIETRSIPRRTDSGELEWDGIAIDVTERKLAEARAERLAAYDALTGLPNRALFMQRLDETLERLPTLEARCAVCILDIDGLRSVNTAYGLEVGDQVLREVGHRLWDVAQGRDLLARQGSDEFLLLLQELRDRQEAEQRAARFLAAFDAPLTVGGHAIKLGASMGVTLAPDDATPIGRLLGNAEAALRQVKRAKGKGCAFYTPALAEEINRRLLIEEEIRDGLARGAYDLHFQPQVDPASARINGCEGLLRLAATGETPPDMERFLTVAEASGLIVDLGRQLFERACQRLADWRRAGLPAVPLAVNLTPTDLQSPDLVAYLRRTIEAHRLDPGTIEIELTERTVLQDIDAARRQMQALAEIGIAFALDDFGTGYSSLRYLTELPFRKVKIDRSFVAAMPRSPRHAAIVQGVATMGRSLGLEVVAEGVETHEQLVYLRAYGCSGVQGFLFSPAVPAEQMAAFLRAGRLVAQGPLTELAPHA